MKTAFFTADPITKVCFDNSAAFITDEFLRVKGVLLLEQTNIVLDPIGQERLVLFILGADVFTQLVYGL